MGNKQIVLSRDNFQTNASNALKQLWDNQDFVDVTLSIVDDKRYQDILKILGFFKLLVKVLSSKN